MSTTSIEKLLRIANDWKYDRDIALATVNKELGYAGVAAFNNDGKTITVYEGDPDGGEDKVVDYATFANNYEFKKSKE